MPNTTQPPRPRVRTDKRIKRYVGVSIMLEQYEEHNPPQFMAPWLTTEPEEQSGAEAE